MLTSTHTFGWLNYGVIILYLLLLLGMGFYFSKRQKNSDDYFTGGGRIPWWAAGISIFGTVLSAISFMAIPAKTFDADWRYLLSALGPVFVAPIVVILFLPFYHQLKVTSAYEYLEHRFNLTMRLIGSVFFILFQMGRISIILLLPAIALNVVTGFSIQYCILIMATMSIAYTMMGGIEGVIWTDVIQVIILFGGVFTALFWMIGSMDQSLLELINSASDQGKLKIADTTFSLNEPTLWVVFFGGLFSNFAFYGSDQSVVQRYVTATNIRDSRKSVWTNAILILPATFLFFSLGTLLFLYYQKFPSEEVAALSQMDAIFPLFIVTELPNGVAGLLIAALFAAAMSSISSSLNSISTAYTVDFHRRFKWEGNELVIARAATLVVGLICLVIALVLASLELRSVWDAFLKMVGLLTGSLGGVFTLGMTVKRVNAKHAIIGFVMSSFLQFYLFWNDSIHLLFFACTGFVSAYVLGFVLSFFVPSKMK